MLLLNLTYALSIRDVLLLGPLEQTVGVAQHTSHRGTSADQSLELTGGVTPHTHAHTQTHLLAA